MFWKPKPTYAISIPSPCHENWQEMAQAERGRFCQACQTVVTDFTGLSDDEIIKHIEHAAGGKMCGRFLTTQTDRTLLPEIKMHRISTFRKIAATVLMFYASVNELAAQATAAKPKTYSSASTKKPVTNNTSLTIKGKVIDFTNVGVPGLELQLLGTGIVKTTDAHGNFKFVVPDSCTLNELVINPTQNGKLFLDSIGAMIRNSEIDMDTLPVGALLTIKLYPIEVLQEIDVAENIPKAVTRSVQYTTTEWITTSGDILYVKPSKKKIALKKFKDFFRRKKST